MGNKEGIQRLIKEVIRIWYREDHYYVVSESKLGRKTTGVDTVEDMVEHIKRNDFNTDKLSEEDLVTAATEIQVQLGVIEANIWRQYNKVPVVLTERTLDFLEYMKDDYLDLCMTEYCRKDPDHPFNYEELIKVYEQITELIKESR